MCKQVAIRFVTNSHNFMIIRVFIFAKCIKLGTDQNSDFIFTIDDESKGLDTKADSEFGSALGVGALCKAAIGKLLYQWQE